MAYQTTGRVDMNTSHLDLYNSQVNARALIDQSAMVYCASKPRAVNPRVRRLLNY